MRIGRYTASSHAQNRIVDRNIKKIDVVEHVYRRPIEVTKVKKVKYKVSEFSLNTLITEVLPKLKLSLPLSEEDICDIVDYFFHEESNLANAKENYNETINEKRLALVCKLTDEFNKEPLDLEDLNSRLMK